MILKFYRNMLMATKDGLKNIYFTMALTPVKIPVKKSPADYQKIIRRGK